MWLDPSNPDTVYVGTDVGAFVTTNRGGSWQRLGSGMPKVAVWQLDYDAKNGVLAAGTHGRGAYTLNNRNAEPALVVSKADSGVPVGPGRNIDYTVTVKNLGNAAATGVTVSDPLPANTTFVSAGQGGKVKSGKVRLEQPDSPGRRQPRADLHRDHLGQPPVVGHGHRQRRDQGHGEGRLRYDGSPRSTPIAPPHAVTIEPTSDIGGAKVGTSATYTETVTNEGYQPDSYALTTTGAWPATTYDSTCTTPMSTTPTIQPGASVDVCVKVAVPAGAANDARNDATVKATSTADAGVSASATLTTIAVAVDTLLVDNDTNDPVDSAPYYQAALTANGASFSTWSLADDPALPQTYLTAHKTVVWETGNSYPAPITPYEKELKAFLDGGGRLFMSGQDILDQAAGTTAFVHDYLHIDWDGTEVQNDKQTANVTGVTGNPVTNGIGTVTLDHSVLGATFEDQITPDRPGNVGLHRRHLGDRRAHRGC